MSRNALRLSFGGGRSELSRNAADSLLAGAQRLADSDPVSRSGLDWQIAAAHIGDLSATAALASIAARAADQEIVIERVLRAPLARVYEAWTTPALIMRWWGGRRGTVHEVEVDPRVGGRWRVVRVGGAGTRTVCAGEFREIVPLERITWMQRDEPSGRHCLISAAFADLDGQTRVSVLMHHRDAAARAAAIRSGIDFAVRDQLTLLEGVARAPIGVRANAYGTSASNCQV